VLINNIDQVVDLESKLSGMNEVHEDDGHYKLDKV
jgi:hypothetical protein